MKIFGKNLKKDILYIAEIGVNHEGNLKRCFKLIKDAKIAGADVVKFQCFTPTKYISINEKKFKKISKFYFDKSQFNKIIKFCKKLKINYLFTPVSHDWLNFIRKNSKTVKIASGDLNFHYLLKKATKFNLNIFLSTGISDLEEIKAAVRIIKDKYRKKIKQKLVLMHCVSSYPVPDAFANTMSVKFLKDKFNFVTGYSNHVIGINACLTSICLGARVIEFHLTDNKKRKFRDHHLSLNKYDVKKLIHMGNNFNLLIGKYEKEIPRIVRASKNILSKGIVAKKDLNKNHVLTIDDLDYARPAKYYHANQIKSLLKKKLKQKVKYGMLIKRSNLY